MNSPTEVLGQQIRRTRQRCGMTAKEVCAAAGIASASYACLEGGHYRWNVDTLLRVQLVLHVPITDLWPFPIAPLRGDVTDEVLQAECRKARLHWMPDADWVLLQVSNVCRVPLEVLTNENAHGRRIDAKTRRARTVAALLVRDLEGITQREMAKALNTDSSVLADAARKAGNPGHGYEWDSYERVKERLERCYFAPPMHAGE